MGILDLVEQRELAKKLMNQTCLIKGHQYSLLNWADMICLRCKEIFPVELGNIDENLRKFL